MGRVFESAIEKQEVICNVQSHSNHFSVKVYGLVLVVVVRR